MLSFQDAHICLISIFRGAEHVKRPWEAIKTDLLTLPYGLEICYLTPEIVLPEGHVVRGLGDLYGLLAQAADLWAKILQNFL